MPTVAINALTAPDAYTAASTIDLGRPITYIRIDVANQAIYWQPKIDLWSGTGIGRGTPSGDWDMATYLLPSYSVFRQANLVGVRFQAAIPLASLPVGATQAVVTVRAVL